MDAQGGADKILAEEERQLSKAKEEKQSERPAKGKKNFLVIYGMTLMIIAFVLVLLSYLNEMRVNQAEIADLIEKKEQFSISALQDIKNLEDNNKRLEAEKESLFKENAELKDQMDAIQQLNEELNGENVTLQKSIEKITAERDLLKAQQNAVDAMLHISELYQSRKYSAAAYEISELETEHSPSIDSLFEGSGNGERIIKLSSRYQEIRAWLEKRGYMDPERIEKWKASNIKEETGGN